MKIKVYFDTINSGFVEIEVDKTKSINEYEIYEKAWDKVAEGDSVEWERTNTNFTDWEKVED